MRFSRPSADGILFSRSNARIRSVQLKCPPSQIHARQGWIAITYSRRSRSHRLDVDRRRAHSLPLVAIVGKDLLEGIPSELSRRLVRLKEEKGEARRIQPNETMTKEQERKSTAIRRFPLSPGVLPIWEPT
jgi:hypothetical protein